MGRPHASTAEPGALFDERLLRPGRVPADLPLDGRPLLFLWQVPGAATLARLRHRYGNVPVLISRFDTETAVEADARAYWIPSDFFDLRALHQLILATTDARLARKGEPEPTYEGMSLVDGDYARLICWYEMVASAAMLLCIRMSAPQTPIISDWVGTRIAAGAGLPTRRMWLADLADRNWPFRRAVREALERWRPSPGNSEACSGPAGPGTKRVDVVFLLGGWVEQRLLDTFPIEALARDGHNCEVWATRRSQALEALLGQGNITCRTFAYPAPAPGVSHLSAQVGHWCDRAIDNNYFAPLRGDLARAVVSLINWPRWAGKLVAMHHMMMKGLKARQPRLLVGLADKDWPAYCAHHAARSLGIPSVGFRHGGWPAGTFPERYDHLWYFPAAAQRVFAFTPDDEAVSARAQGMEPGRVVWRGNMRLDHSLPPAGLAGGATRILVACHAAGPGSPTSLRRRMRPLNVQLIRTLHARLGDRMRIRTHPGDSAAHLGEAVAPLILPGGEDLAGQLADCAAVVTTYSTVALDAAAGGRPVFIWDYAGFDYHLAEAAREGGWVAEQDLEQLASKVARFLNDPIYRQELEARAVRFPAYLRRRTPYPGRTLGENVIAELRSCMKA